MKFSDLPKTHYQIVREYYKSIGADLSLFLELIVEAKGEDFCFNDVYKFFLSKKDIFPHLVSDDLSLLYHANILFHLVNIIQNRDKIYYVPPVMAIKLVGVDLNVDVSYLKSPFREIYIQVDRGLLQMEGYGAIRPGKADIVNVDGIYVYLKEGKDGEKEIRIMAVSNLKPIPGIPMNDAVFYYKIPLKKGCKLKTAVKDYVKKLDPDELKKFNGGYSLDYVEVLTGFVFNTLLYITSKDAEIRKQLPRDFDAEIATKKNKAKKRKLEKAKERSSKLNTFLVAPSSFLPGNVLSEARSGKGLFSWKLTKKVDVGGHWKRQWYGSEKDNSRESKVIFVDAYQKGIGKEVSSKVRRVGKK